MAAPPAGKRPDKLKDRLLAERVVREHFPGEAALYQAPIYDVRGIDKKMLETFGVFFFERAMPRADILIIRPTEVIIAEVKTHPLPRHVAQLEYYVDALKHDVVRADEIRGKKIRAIFVAGHDDARVEALVKSKGFEYVYLPAT